MINKDIGLYIHIPFCQQKCSYCDFAAYQNIERWQNDYVNALLKEIEYYGNLYKNIELDTIYFGGGTPTHFSINLIETIFNQIKSFFSLSKCRDISIESNPGEIDFNYYKRLKDLGFTRISCGVQTLNNNLLVSLNRTHTAEDVFKTLEDIHKAGFIHSNVDIIYGLPDQTLEDLINSLQLLKMPIIDHVSIYGLQLESSTYLYTQYLKGELNLPNDDLRDKMYDLILSECKSNNFEHYEISNFARNNGYGEHNLRYWQYKEYIGIGAGAHGFLGDIRYGNTPYVVPYINKINNQECPIVEKVEISDKRHIEDYCIMHLRTKWGISSFDFYNKFGINFDDLYKNELDKLEKQNLITKTNNSVHLTTKGIKYGNYVFSEFIKN